MVDLGTLGGSFSGARAVSESGQIVGDSSLPGDSDYHAFSWTAAGGMVDIHSPGAAGSEAVAVNSNGQVVGTSYYAWPRDEYRGFSWTAKGGLVDLGRLGSLGNTETIVFGVNDRGQVVGTSGDRNGHHSAFVWTATGGMVGLGEVFSEADAVNASGQIAGYSPFFVSRPMGDVVEYHAALWNARSFNFRFSGVKIPPAFNEVVAGRAVSVSFSLGGNFGLAIFDEDSPTFERIACGASASGAPIEPTSVAPPGRLFYKPQVDRYAYASKTDRNWAGTCRSLTLRLNDWSSHVVYFSFK
jgi:probable HAF family extracellular repeat protein